jgi:hypothetical protein
MPTIESDEVGQFAGNTSTARDAGKWGFSDTARRQAALLGEGDRQE